MKFVSFNVNGLRAILKKTFIEDFDKFDADIFSLNETKLSDDSFPFMPEGYNVYHTYSKVRKGYSGVAVFSKKLPLNVHYGLLDNKYDDEGRVITLEFEKFYYVACYVPNAGDELKRMDFRMQFEKDLIEYFSSLNKPIVYCGDLNVAHNPIDLKNPKSNTHNAGFTIEERTAFNNLLSQGYIDTFRYLYPEVIKYSWWSYMFNSRKNNAGWRIDYYLVSEEIKDLVKDAEIHNDVYGSDHCPVSLTIDF
ncbi:MAG: exodeoxyribonuclease III [Erysipelotrichaceae bacterium]|nr:exodeoxyribonuclease III [Erysipelotrichaceae bacterium]